MYNITNAPTEANFPASISSRYKPALWKYIQEQLIDETFGEWHWSRLPDGSINKTEDKAGFWKCPYHNDRMCWEMMVENVGT